MVSSPDDFHNLISTAADERQLRISAFKNRVATLRATSKVYNITSDKSINTLDSSTVATADSGARKDAGATANAAAPAQRTPERRCPEEENNPFADSDSEDDGSGDDKRTSAENSPTEAAEAVESSPIASNQRSFNPFLDSDSDMSSGKEPIVDSSLEGDSKSEGSSLFVKMANMMKEDEIKEKDKQSKSVQPMSLQDKIGTTGRPGVAQRTISSTSKQSSTTAVSGALSDSTFSTFDGFSMESIVQETGGSQSSAASGKQSASAILQAKISTTLKERIAKSSLVPSAEEKANHSPREEASDEGFSSFLEYLNGDAEAKEAMDAAKKAVNDIGVEPKTDTLKRPMEVKEQPPSGRSNNPFGEILEISKDIVKREGLSVSALIEKKQSLTKKSTNIAADKEPGRLLTADALDAESFSATSTEESSEPPTNSKPVNPFAALLEARQARKMAMKRLAKTVGSLNEMSMATLESSLDEDRSLSLNSDGLSQSTPGKKKEKKVFFADEADGESLDGALFSDLKKALSKVQSVDNEEETCEDENEDGADSVDKPATQLLKSHLIVKKESESCGVSSLKDASHFDVDNDYIPGDPFADDDSCAVMSVPKSPAPLEKPSTLLREWKSSVSGNNQVQTQAAVARVTEADSGDSVTVACSNSNKADYLRDLKDRDDRGVTLTPPKKGVIMSDGSISTKDSILGTTINVTNGDLVAERIYLESLRAQVLAELKVHVADEEIRLALDARLQAIQDYYKRKATVIQLKPVMTAYSPQRDLDDIFHKSLGDLPKVKPTVVVQNKSIEGSQGHMNMAQQRQFQHKFAFERMQGQIDEAIKAAHGEESPVREEEKKTEEEDEPFNPFNGQSPKTPVPLNITCWDDNEDLSKIHGATPASTPGAGGTSIEKSGPPTQKEAMENAWIFYRKINALIFDNRIYDYEFSLLQEDPLYPYLNSLVGIADSGEDGYTNENKRISQPAKIEYKDMSPHRICHDLTKEAEGALDELKSICAYIGSKLGMQTMAVGPMKKPSEALLKSEKKYKGDPLLVTDYCRASLFVKDIASLLALIEIVLSKYASVVRCIKLSTLKSDRVPLVGGYRDCKINIDVGGHVCEIQVHLISMWLIKEGKGYAHYKECREYHVDISSFDISRTLSGLDRKVLADLIKTGEGSLTRSMPVSSLRQFNEDQIRDYFALANIYLYYGLPGKAEYIMRRLVKLRSESDEFGPYHAETLLHLEILWKSLKCQHKHKSASSVKSQIKKARKMQQHGDVDEPDLSELVETDQCGAIDHVCDMILDPSKKEREEEKRKVETVEESRAMWLKVRRQFFQ